MDTLLSEQVLAEANTIFNEAYNKEYRDSTTFYPLRNFMLTSSPTQELSEDSAILIHEVSNQLEYTSVKNTAEFEVGEVIGTVRQETMQTDLTENATIIIKETGKWAARASRALERLGYVMTGSTKLVIGPGQDILNRYVTVGYYGVASVIKTAAMLKIANPER